jgi:hypothetical protein
MLSQEKTSASPRSGRRERGFLPGCGACLRAGAAFVQEFWAGEDRNFLCWCAGCGLMCTVVISSRLVSDQPEH